MPSPGRAETARYRPAVAREPEGRRTSKRSGFGADAATTLNMDTSKLPGLLFPK